MTDWVRLWHDMPTDPKWRVVARRSGQPLPAVIAVFTMMMTNASANSVDRGTLAGWDDEDIGAALDMEGADVCAIREAMQGKVLDGTTLTGWERRQPKREDGTAAERKAAWKARQGTQRNAEERTGTQADAPETETETDIVDVGGGDGASPIDFQRLNGEASRAAGIKKVAPTAIAANIGILREWIADGATPDEILRTIADVVATASAPIHSLNYFAAAVRQTVARRENLTNGTAAPRTESRSRPRAGSRAAEMDEAYDRLVAGGAGGHAVEG